MISDITHCSLDCDDTLQQYKQNCTTSQELNSESPIHKLIFNIGSSHLYTVLYTLTDLGQFITFYLNGVSMILKRKVVKLTGTYLINP